MIAPTLRVKIVGEDPELDKIEQSLKKFIPTLSRSTVLEEACELQEEDPAEVFVLGPSLYFQTHLNRLQKLAHQRPEVVLAVGTKLPNLAKILVPHVVYGEWAEEEIHWIIKQAADFHRRSRRLEALRDHHKRRWNVESNPAINLVTNIMRKCTMAEDYNDLLGAVLSLKNVVDFHDASLLVMRADGSLLEGWHSTKESKDKLKELPIPPADFSKLQSGEAIQFSSSENQMIPWEKFTLHPWSFGLALRFSENHFPGTKKSAVVILYRRELVPFAERDFWLLEMAYGPLNLALEKISMLKAISRASKEWRSTFDGISEPLTVIDENYQIIKANRAFASLVEQDIKKIKNKKCYSLLANRRTPCIGCPVGRETQPQSGTRIQLPSNAKKDLLVWSYAVRAGMEAYRFQFYRNVSKETQLTSVLIQSEKMAALGKLVGAVAHEINNPLAAILATSQILLSEDNLESSVREDIEEIHSAAQRSKKIIDDLLGFTTAGQENKEKTNLLEVIRSALTFSKTALKDSIVHLESELEEAWAMAPTGALQQILFNLITNAAQAMDGKGKLCIHLHKAETGFKLHVQDSGPGIPQERLKHIFDPFFTSKQEGVGTGLGLSIVRNLTQKIGVKIEVHSTLGEGTEFILTIPGVQ